MPADTTINRLKFPESVATQERIIELTDKIAANAFGNDKHWLSMASDIKSAVNHKDAQAFSLWFDFFVCSAFFFKGHNPNLIHYEAELNELNHLFDELYI